MAEEGRIYGIDLGTTYSCISYLDETDHAVVCQSQEGSNTIPSVVRLMPGEDPVVGETAKDTSVIYAENTIQFVKSRMGREESFEYGPEDDRHTTTPEDVSSYILMKCARDASMTTNSEVKAVVITVPAYFGVREKEATKKAGEKAGLTVVDIVEEPTAAAFYYGVNNDEDSTVCIFDLGGGTFDVTAMEINKEGLFPITTEGDHDLGGKKWDEEIKNLLKEKFRDQTGYSGDFDEDFEQELQIMAEKVKKHLSNADKDQVALKVDKQHRANIEITREEFEARTEFLLGSAIDLTKQVFDRVSEKGKAIDKILLVGGSTFMPQVSNALEKEFHVPIKVNEPNEAVSKGACIYCAYKIIDKTDNIIKKITQNSDGTTTVTIPSGTGEQRIEVPSLANGHKKIVTIATKSYGIKVLVGKEKKEQISNMVFKDSELPASETGTFGLEERNQTSIGVELYQSENYDKYYDLEDGVLVENAILEDIPEGLPEGTLVELTITVETNGLITVTGAMKEDKKPLKGSLNTVFEEGIGKR